MSETTYRFESCRGHEIVGAPVAQLGERLNGIQEVRGSIPLGSMLVEPFG